MKAPKTHGVQGATFGVMEASIMMLGVLLGLSVTGNRFVISLGLLTAGVADALANSASFYVSEESEKMHKRKEIWKSAWLCFLGTFLTVAAITFPVMIVADIGYAIISSFAIGMVILFFLGKYMSERLKAKNPAKTTTKYILIGVATALVCFIVGSLLNMMAVAPSIITFK